MTHERDRQSGSEITIVVVVVLLLLVGLLFLMGVGALFFTRASTQKHRVALERERAVAAAQHARLQQARAQMELENARQKQDGNRAARSDRQAAGVDSVDSDTRRLVIQIDSMGNMSVDGVSDGLAELQPKLRSGGELSVVIEVDDRCQFEGVANVLALCREAGVFDVGINSASVGNVRLLLTP